MDKIRRNERMSAMMKMLSSAPNRIFTLNSFCDMFGSAKSTMSEDVDLLREVCEAFDLGTVETVTGAAGGVRYRPAVSREKALATILELCEKLSGTERVLPGGFLYYSDILSTPDIVNRMGEIIASEYAAEEPDFVLTMETKGIPVAFATANALGIPLVIARHSSKVYEGSAVNINYVSGSGSIETMSLSRRAVKENQRALIVDDFLKGGGGVQRDSGGHGLCHGDGDAGEEAHQRRKEPDDPFRDGRRARRGRCAPGEMAEGKRLNLKKEADYAIIIY